ncbi:MAG: DUF5050 domain-containing protein [Lachnospiraceae bacterium]|nr:DUF5050 domain-containing protein [Lachnospiraceae bacterium]
MKKTSSIKSSIRFLFVLAAGLFLLSACGRTEQKHTGDSTVAHAESNVVFSDFEYPYIAESANGYYFWERISEDQYYPRLMFMDKESGVIVPLCNKPNCMHEGKECNAYYPKVGLGEDGISKYYLQYYKENLYAVGLSADNYVSLFRIKEDGTEWEICTKLYRSDYDSTMKWLAPDILIQDGYVYYIDNKQNNMKLERRPIDGGNAEVVFEEDSDADYNKVYRMEGHDGKIFFQAVSFFGENFDYTGGSLYQYDIKSGQCNLLKSGVFGPYSVRDDMVYYGNMEGICRYSIQNQTTEVLVNQPMNVPNITLTRDYIILCDQMGDGDLFIYDYEGTQIATVSCELKPSWYFGGNSELLFADCVSNGKTSRCFLDLNRPVTELRWEELREK